ncbi:hypothetical protein ILUMI_14171, partial [Ignelater luminosus]
GSIIPISKLRINGNTSFCKVGKYRIVHKVTNSIVHPKFDDINFRNDVAVLKVSPPFKGKYQKPIKLFSPSMKLRLNQRAYALGWGVTDLYDEEPSEQLRIVDLRLFRRQRCRIIFGTIVFQLPREGICAGWLNKRKDTCFGDSGGPLFVNLGNNKKPEYFQIGKTKR